MYKFDPNNVIEYGSWLECMNLFNCSEPDLTTEIDKRINNTVTYFLSKGITDVDSKQSVKENAMKQLQSEQQKNDARIAYLTDNNPIDIFENLLVLGKIYKRVIDGTISKLLKIN